MVRIRYKTGTVRNVPAYVGKRLVERRIADYEDSLALVNVFDHSAIGDHLITDEGSKTVISTMQAAVGQQPMVHEPEIDIDALTRDELYDLAVERGLDPHPQLGATKLKALLK